jgi:hypothetical protein
MIRLLLISAMALTLLFSSVSCTRKHITASGLKQSSYTKFNFRINNNQTTRASLYKRYIAHNRNFKDLPKRNRNPKPGPAQNKRYLAQKN